MGRNIKSFYSYMMQYPHKIPDRLALAKELRRLSKDHPEVKAIDSMTDLFLMSSLLKDHKAHEAVSGGLWVEYCMACGRPLD